MNCGKLFCTCCETAYANGLADGFKSGFGVGVERGYRAGYVSGYVDAANGRAPLRAYADEINHLLPAAFNSKLPAPYSASYEPPELPEVKVSHLGERFSYRVIPVARQLHAGGCGCRDCAMFSHPWD
jgi:hypothetical protein